MSSRGLPAPAGDGIRPSALRACRIGLRLWWDNAGLVTALNLAWFALAVGIAWGPALAAAHVHSAGPSLAAAASAVWAAGALSAGPARILALRARLEPAGLPDLLAGFRDYGVRFGVLALVTVGVVGEGVFYSRWLASAAVLLAPLPLWVVVFWLAALPYQVGLAVLEDRPALEALRRSCLLTLDNPLYSLGVLVLTAGAAALLAASGIGLGIAALVLALSFSLAATIEVMRKYRRDPDFDGWYPAEELGTGL